MFRKLTPAKFVDVFYGKNDLKTPCSVVKCPSFGGEIPVFHREKPAFARPVLSNWRVSAG
jgi:hypothetical protein